jgi:hypothetical protein
MSSFYCGLLLCALVIFKVAWIVETIMIRRDVIAFVSTPQPNRARSSSSIGSSLTWRVRQLSADGSNDANEEGDTDKEFSEEEKLQMKLNTLVEDDDPSMIGWFTPSNFDDSKLPIPVFTSVLVLLGSLYFIFYGIYVGLYGFPGEDVGLPRPF